ncbi:MAG: sugar transferase [Caulobacteraceae bacterium]
MAVAAIALIIFAPLMLIAATAVFVGSQGPVLFAHRRVGLGGRQFNVWKFRTMHVNGDAILRSQLAATPAAAAEWALRHKLRADPRVTAVGGFLRSTSIDEFPQLLNVLKGDMSIVGPRPIVSAEVHRYGAWFNVYCTVRPGITGLWQVSGRSNVSYRRRVILDVLYARRKTLAFDIKIMLATLPAVLTRRGSY